MKMQLKLGTVTFAVMALSASAAQAILYDLKSDFSDIANPNGVWSFKNGTSNLPHFPQPTVSNPFNGTAANGYWGAVSDFFGTPFIYKATADATVAGQSIQEFVIGDVVAHSTNVGGNPFSINWTAPVAGSIIYSGATWYAHTSVTRSNDYHLTLNGGADLASGTVATGVTRSNPLVFSSVASTSVAAGDVLSFSIVPSAGQSFGSIDGVNFTVNFTPVPEPTTAMVSATLLGFCVRRKR